MGVPDNSLLDLLEKVRSWIYWGTSDINSMSGEVKMSDVGQSQTMCCECEMRISESCLGYNCGRCSRLFCERCVQAGLDIRSCKFCANFEIKQKIGGKFSHKIHPSDSPEPPSVNYSGEKFDRSSLKAVYVRHSTGRSDEDEAEDSSRNIISPYSLDTSDIDSSSPSDSPFGAHLTTPRFLTLTDSSFDPEPVLALLKSPTTNNDLSISRDQYGPLDLQNNGLIWFPLPLDDDEDEETTFFSYSDDDDDDDETGPPGASDDKKPLENVVQGHFRALVSQLLQSESMEADNWVDIITSLAWQAANFVKPDTSKGGSMDPGDYVKIKCVASGIPNESMFVKGVVCTKNIKHKRMTSQYKNPRLLILGGALEYQRAHNQLASIETLLQQEIDHLKTIVSRIESRRPNVLLVEKSVSPYAQEYLLAKDISLVSNIKRPLLERIARCTGAPITQNTDQISTTRIGQCELFRLERFSENHEAVNQFTKKTSKTLMFFDGCPRRLGCTVLLKGSCREELKKVKHVVQYAVFAAYHLSLETSFLADEGATLPKMTIKPSVTAPERLNVDEHDVSLAVDNQNSPITKDKSVISHSDPSDVSEEITSSETTENNQSILVSFSSRCVLNGNICERSRLLRIKFYGCFDKPLGRYLQDDLFNQTSSCGSCNEPVEAHVTCYTHQQGNLTINVKRVPSLNLPGEKDKKIWMWHRCLRCARVDGVPPVTRRVVMSDAAWGLSFGKFLELSFSNHATANRVAGCGHSLQRDCLRFYGLGSMVVFFRYSPIDILSVRLPPAVLEFSGHVQQGWLKKEVTELLRKTRMLYDEILEVLHQTELKSVNDDDLSKHIEELKDMLMKERNVYIDLLQPHGEEIVTEIDIFELNRLRHSLTVGLNEWDRRLLSLNSNVEVKHRRCYSTLEPIVDHGQTVNDLESSQLTQSESTDEIDSSPSEDSEAVSFLSDKIDSAWTGPLTRPENPHIRRLTSTPARVYSFDSAMTLQERIKNQESRQHYMHMVKVKVKDHVFSCEDQKMGFFSKTNPLFIPDGARLMLPHSSHNAVIAVYENEPTSIISYALCSREYKEYFTDKPYLTRNHSIATSKLSAWQSFGSNDFGSDDLSTGIGPLFSDAKSSHHLTIPFEDESQPGGKVKFSVTCYFAKQFDSLRKKCCPNEVDFLRSLTRCKRWSAQGGKSGAYFAKTLDERFLIKGVTKTELESFEEFAPQYFKYLTESLNSGSPTCLAKIIGIYQVSVKHLRGGKEAKMHVMVMENLFFKKSISRVYDLKGSARSRYNSDMTGTNKTLLDMNLLEALRTNPMFLGSKAKRNLERAVWNDTSFLASIDVMDYSLLVGVDEESKELVVGIIDFMRQYTWDKQLETWVKASGILGGPKNASPTIISPKQYKRRFRKAMTSYFLTVPDQWSF